MASPKAHSLATVILTAALYVIGFFAGFVLDYRDIFWLVVFGVLIDVDHIPFGRLWRAFCFGGAPEVKKRWKRYGWFDADHLNIFHTWSALAGVMLFTLFSNSWMPLVGFSVHCLIDGFSLSGQDYPRCSPISRDIGRLLIRLGLKRFMYETEGVPSPSVID